MNVQRYLPDSDYIDSPMTLFAILAGTTGVMGSYVLTGSTPRFIVAPIDQLVVQLTPGPIVAFMIQNVGDPAHLIHLTIALAIAIGLLAGTALIGMAFINRFDHRFIGGTLTGSTAWLLTTLITNEPLFAVGAAGPVAIVTIISIPPASSEPTDQPRRRVLKSLIGAVGFMGLTAAVNRGATTTSNAQTSQEMDPGVASLMKEADDKSLTIQGDIPSLVSTFEEFYNVDIAQFDPRIGTNEWSLTITGEETETIYSFEDITSQPTEHRFVTLRCVGESLNGHKLDNAIWTGTPIKPLLEAADPAGACGCAMLHADDDYFVQFPVEALENGFLAWGMNGAPLPKSHGHPVRILIPGHWGETNVKWLREIELLNEAMDGYWEQRGWHGTGPVNTVAKLWSDVVLENGNIEVAGHAYAGTRGIERVEVSIDGGATWHDAELSEPLTGTDVWRQWRYEFTPAGTHEVVVRATDGTGALQPETPAEAYPSGASGWVSKTVRG